MVENTILNVLMIEDNPGDVQIVRERLTDVPGYQFEITHVMTLQEAIDALERSRMDAVILDLGLPDSAGIDTVKRLRGVQDDIAVVVLSGSSTEETHRLALREGAHDFVGKNDPPARLLARSILFALERNRSQKPQQQIKKLVSANPDAVIVVDLDGIVQFVNEAAIELFGKRREDFVGELLGFSIKEGALSEIEVLKNGERRTAEIHVVQIEWNWKPALLASIRDTTEQKRLAEQFREAQKMEAIGRLAGGVAHDFNNLLCVVIGFGELLKREVQLDSLRRQYLEEIIKAGEHAAALTRQLLAFSRRQVIQPRTVDLNAVVLDMEKLLFRVIGEDIILISSTPDHPCHVKVDPVQIEQVIMNLAVNARDAMQRGGKLSFETSSIWLDEEYSRKHPEIKPGPHVVLTVSDTGHGMDKLTLSKIFDPFFTTKEVGKGTGLGLATVYGIVKQLEGHIWVYSEPGMGTTFKIYFPESTEPPSSIGRTTINALLGNGWETVLLVEDEEVVRTFGREVLQADGYTVLTASHGHEALLKAAQYEGPIHLLITDLVMPGMSGRELAKRLSAERPDMRVLMVSGYAADSVAELSVLDPGISFLEKPFIGDLLRRKVWEVLNTPQPRS